MSQWHKPPLMLSHPMWLAAPMLDSVNLETFHHCTQFYRDVAHAGATSYMWLLTFKFRWPLTSSVSPWGFLLLKGRVQE